MIIKLFRWLLLLVVLNGTAPFLFSSVEKMKCPMGRDYDLYLPAKIDPDRIYWLVCYVHGANGSASDHVPSLNRFVEQRDCIGIAPSFARGFQLVNNKTDQQLIGIFHQLSTKYKLHAKLFVYGHSAGGQFAHRFMLRHPNLVIGCESCSSGTWATGGIYQSLTSAAQNIPVAIACGGDDVGKKGAVIARLAYAHSRAASSVQEHCLGNRVRVYHDGISFPLDHPEKSLISQRTPQSQKVLMSTKDSDWTRIEWFEKFRQQLQERNFFFTAKIFPHESHNVQQAEQTDLAMEAFLLGTSGMLAEERTIYDTLIAEIKKNKADEKKALVTKALQELQQKITARSKEALRKKLLAQGWHVNEVALDQCLRAGKGFIDEEISFLQK